MTANKHDTYTVKSKLVGTTFFLFNLELVSQVGRSVVERPLLMLEVRGSNPVHSASKNTTNPEAEWFPEEPGAPPDL